jgi:hypothetical protein
VINIDKKKVTILLTALTVAAIMSGIALSVYAADNGNESSNGFAGWCNGRMMMAGPYGETFRRQHRWEGPGFIEVSDEFKENAISIAESDSDVQALLDDGYNITRVRPFIKTLVEADGAVETKAADVIVMLKNDEAGHAAVCIDLEEAKVTKIVILTRTVIEKP